eukprot:PhM_4_TR6438/c0_g1_i1/m.50525/K14379/ACP5; tartrate-resistant acid phosphatase type 5
MLDGKESEETAVIAENIEEGLSGRRVVCTVICLILLAGAGLTLHRFSNGGSTYYKGGVAADVNMTLPPPVKMQQTTATESPVSTPLKETPSPPEETPATFAKALDPMTFRQLVMDDYRASVTEDGTERGVVNGTRYQDICMRYENGANMKDFFRDMAGYKRKLPDDDRLMFYAFGDWGYKLGRQKRGAKGPPPWPCMERSCHLSAQIDKQLEAEGASSRRSLAFNLLLGDNFYPIGIRHKHDARRFDFDAKFLRVQHMRVPYYVTLGNHDSYGNAQAQVEVSSLNPFWNCPDYKFVSPVIRRGAITVQIFSLNTRLHFEANWPEIPKQVAWLDAALGNSTAMWKIVMAHEPIFCFADFPHEKAMVEHIHPLLNKHKVPIYLSGHAHHLSLFQAPGGYYHITSGGYNGHIQSGVANRKPNGKYHVGSGFQRVILNRTHAVVEAFNHKDTRLWDVAVPLDAAERSRTFTSTDPWLWKFKPVCEARGTPCP